MVAVKRIPKDFLTTNVSNNDPNYLNRICRLDIFHIYLFTIEAGFIPEHKLVAKKLFCCIFIFLKFFWTKLFIKYVARARRQRST